MMRLLVSARSVQEALVAARAGAHFIDLKEPAAGALGGLPPRRIARIVRALRAGKTGTPISATIGDVPASCGDEILRRVAAVWSCGVDYVKVGIAPGDGGELGTALLERLAHCGATVVPVLLADQGVDAQLLEAALQARAFPALMLDTADKRHDSLLQRVHDAALHDFVAQARAHGCLAGLAGALRGSDLPALLALGPDFAGFRSAVCAGDRAGELDGERVGELARRLAARAAATALA